MYSVPQYLKRLRQAKRSEKTVALYSSILTSFANYTGVSVQDLHNYLDPETLIKYAEVLHTLADRTRRVHLGVIRRFYTLNGVQFDELEINVGSKMLMRHVFAGDKVMANLDTLQVTMKLTQSA